MGFKELRLRKKEEEEDFYGKMSARMKKMEQRLFYTKEFFFNRKTLISKLRYKAAKLYISHTRKNSFITIADIFGENYDKETKVAYKMSCGSIGYRGPKKSTKYAKEEVLKRSGQLLNDKNYTCADIIFTANVLRWGRRQLRSIFNNLIYIRMIKMNAQRAHGYTRLQKAKRK